MKNLFKALVLILVVSMATLFASCGYVDEPADEPAACTHADTDNDHKCNTCGETVSECSNNNKDHKCDVCGKSFGECADNDSDHYCDVCEAEFSDCDDINPIDHRCDVCGEVLGGCANNIGNDHLCDHCGEPFGTCADNNNDHYCDMCKDEMSSCSDGDDDDHKCDVCDKALCYDKNGDGYCDEATCGDPMCYDNDNDCVCDDETCKKPMHVNDIIDHLCDKCSTPLSSCSDVTTDTDHLCDVCSAKLSSCVDDNVDGWCDVCNAAYKDPSSPTAADFENSELPSNSFVKHYDASKNEITDFASQDSTAATVFSIADDPTGAANKVLKISKLRDDNGANTVYTRAIASNENQTGSCVTLEFKMYSTLNIQYDTNYVDFYFTNDSGELANRLSFYLYQKNAGGTNWIIRENNSAGSGSSTVVNADGTYDGYAEGASLKVPNADGAQTEFKSDVPSGEWVSFKIEFYEAGTLDSYAKVWVNGVLVADGVYHNASVAYDNFAYVQIRHHSKTRNDGITYFDDISVTLTDKEYVYTDTTAPVVSDFEDGELESDYITNIIGLGDSGEKEVAEFTEGEMAGYVGSYVTLSVTEDPTDATNKVLMASKVRQPATGTSSNGTASYTSKTRVALSNEVQTGEYYTFKTDLYISNVQYDVTIFNIVGSDGNKLVSLRFYNNTANTFYVMTNNADGATGCTGSAQLKDVDGNTLTYSTNTWYTLRFEWYRGGEADTTMAKVYICERGGEEVCIFSGNMWNYYGVDQRTVSYVEIQHRSARAGITYFDNVSFTRTNKVYEA